MNDWRAYMPSYPDADSLKSAWTRVCNYVHTKYHATWAYASIHFSRYWEREEPPYYRDTILGNSYEFVKRRD